jgi:CarD family transcriptional regulator
MFNVGDLAVYPAHGVGLIENIEKKSISGIELIFYVIRILDNDMKIMIPKKKDIKFTPQTWNRRYREYMDKIKTGSIFDLAAVLRDLYILQMDKPLSFGEKKMLDTAKGLLVKELSVAKEKREEEITEGIESIFNNVSAVVEVEA